MKLRIRDSLRYGKENAIKTKVLAEALDAVTDQGRIEGWWD